MRTSEMRHHMDGVRSNRLTGIDPASIRLTSDRVLIRDLEQNEVDHVGSIYIPEEAREKVGGVGKEGRLRLGIVVAMGPGDRFLEVGLDGEGVVRRRLIESDCSLCIGTGNVTHWNQYQICLCGNSCPKCDGTGRTPVTVPPQCAVGDTVIFDLRREMEIYLDGVRFSIVNASQSVLAVVEES